VSDIPIRLDGLALAAAIALSALIFAVISIVALIMAACSEQHRDHRIKLAKMALVQCGMSLVCLVAAIIFIDRRPSPLPSIDWIDWLILPWTVLFSFGVARLIRLRKFPGKTS